MKGRNVTCADCGRDRENMGRGLCHACYHQHRKSGTLDQFARTTRPVVDTLDELRWAGLDEREPIDPQIRVLAPRLGMTRNAASRAYYRAHGKVTSS